MFSDCLESPSKDCFSFNDQSSTYDMAEMNEITNHTNMDYVLDSYYSTRVSQFDSGFELPEDCKNMSFSELFDQELFSTQVLENKDCKLTIKIEEENAPLSTCYSVDGSQDTSNSNSLVNIKENVPMSSSSSIYAPKRGINRTYIKSTNNSDVKNLIFNPFCETEDLGTNQVSMTEIPSIKCEPLDEYDVFEPSTSEKETALCSVKVECDFNPSSSRSSAPKCRGINRTSIKTCTSIENFMYDPFCIPENPVLNQTLLNVTIPNVKKEPEDINGTHQNIVEVKPEPCSVNDLQSTNDVYNRVEVQDNILTSFSENAHLNNHSIDIMTENCDTKDLIYKSLKKNEKSRVDRMVVEGEIPTIKCEPISEYEDNSIADTITCYSGTTDSHRFVKIKDLPSLPKNIIPKHQGITEKSVNTLKSDIKQLKSVCEPVSLVIDQTLVKTKTPIMIKRKPKDINKTIKQKSIGVEFKPCIFPSSLLNKSSNHIKPSVSSSIELDPKEVTNKTSTKNTKSHNNKLSTSNYVSEIHSSGISQTFVKVKNPLVQCELDYVNGNAQNTTNSTNFIKTEDGIVSSLPKCHGISKTSKKTTKNHNVKNVVLNLRPENLGIDQFAVRIEPPLVKCEPIDVKNSPNTIDGHFVKDDFLSALAKSSILKRTKKTNKITANHDKSSTTKSVCKLNNLGTEQALLKIETPVIKQEPEDESYANTKTANKITVNHDKQSTAKSVCKLNNLGSDQAILKNIETPVIKQEPEDESYVFENTSVDAVESFVSETKYIDSNGVHSNNCISVKVENQELDELIKKEDIQSYDISSKNETVDSRTCSVDTEKKKITWEEFRAKRGAIGLSKGSGNNEEHLKDALVTESNKMEAIKQEFNRNTAVYFVGEKRNIKDLEEQNTPVKEMDNPEDIELQNKRMKIEYIKKLLPSSFASEIAKTSSLMKGVVTEDNENDSTSDESVMSYDRSHRKYYNDSHEDERSYKKGHYSRVHPSYHGSRPDYSSKNRRSSSTSSNPDDYYNHNRNDVAQSGQYDQNVRNTAPRPKDQKRVVYVGQIPIRFGKRYLQNRFKEFGVIQSLTLHKKPDFRVYYAFVTYSDKKEAERAIGHGNDDKTQVQLDIRFGERKQTQTPYYDLDDEWLTDWYGYSQPVAVVRPPSSPENVSFEDELKEFHKLAQIKKLNQKSSRVS